MKFREFCESMEVISGESGDHAKISELSNLFQKADDDLENVAVFSKGSIFPTIESNKKVGMGKSMVISSLALASGDNEDEIEEMLKDLGDLGKVAKEISIDQGSGQSTLMQEDLEVSEVYDKLKHISQIEGSGSQKEKKQVLSSLLSSCSGLEGKYIIKMVLDKMRVGIGEGSVRDAIIQAFNVHEDDVKKAIMVNSNVGKVAVNARNGTLNEISQIQVGHPVKAMLAQKIDVEDAINEHGGSAAIEYKYDGARIQIHKQGSDVDLYSRNLEVLTSSLPDVVDDVLKHVDAETAILDGEVVAYEGDTPLEFQEVLKRLRRKYDIEEKKDEINIDIKLFDALFIDGDELIENPLIERRNALEDNCDDSVLSKFSIEENTQSVKDIRIRAIEEGQEGIMAKNPNSVYSPGKRGKNWLKIKRDVETLDCVVTGGEWGEGNRSNWLSSYTLSVKDGSEFKEIGKVGTGFTEEEFKELTEELKPLINEDKGMEVSIKPEVIFEIDYEEIQESPDYGSGYALRFPRFKKKRDNKPLDEADDIEKVERIK